MERRRPRRLMPAAFRAAAPERQRDAAGISRRDGGVPLATPPIVIAGAALLAAMVAIVLARYGAGESGLRVVIRATARTSALCIALAFAGIATRPMLVLLPVSHALHFAAILAVAFLTTPANAHIRVTSIGGIVLFALMIDTAIRPKPGGIAVLWVIFVIAFVMRDMSQLFYPLTLGMLLVAGAVRLLALLTSQPSRSASRSPR